jgi:hypothetical protein
MTLATTFLGIPQLPQSKVDIARTNEIAIAIPRPNASIDRVIHAAIVGLSPPALAAAYWYWLARLVLSPAKQMPLLGEAAFQWMRLANYTRQPAAWSIRTKPTSDQSRVSPRFERR